MDTTDAPPIAPRPARRRRVVLAVVLGLVAIAFAGGCHYVTHGGMNARQKPSALEALVAGRLVSLGIPSDVAARHNPLSHDPSSAAVLAGRELYQRNCRSCHGDDGAGVTASGNGLYPPPASLRKEDLARNMRTDGALFYLIRYGIRNTGMPGWQLTDEETWELVSFVRSLPPASVPEAPLEANLTALSHAAYVGSEACKECHRAIYDRWKKTPMANVVRDPREHPDAIVADLSKPDPLLTFGKDDIALVYGSRWKQRYFKKAGNTFVAFPAQWDVAHKKWKPYVAKDDWWVQHYPGGNFERPTSALCDGCHSVNYDVKTNAVTEWNVGCERCHGPGAEHVKTKSASDIVCSNRLDHLAADDICVSCHSQGRPRTNPIEGKFYDWPVGYDPTKKLADSWKLEEHKLGDTTFTHFADGTAHKNRMQGNDYAASLMYARGVTCASCHDVHGTEHPSQLRKPASQLCLDCHAAGAPNGPRATTLAAHTHHKDGSAGSECIACHMPPIAQTLGDVNVRSHTFRFVSPAVSEASKVPNACNVCHSDKSLAWTADALKSWASVSPWRVAE